MKKKLLASILALSMLLGLLPVTAFAADPQPPSTLVASISFGGGENATVGSYGSQSGADIDNAITGSATLTAAENKDVKLVVTLADETNADGVVAYYLVEDGEEPDSTEDIDGETTFGTGAYTSNNELTLKPGPNTVWVLVAEASGEPAEVFKITVNLQPEITATALTIGEVDPTVTLSIAAGQDESLAFKTSDTLTISDFTIVDNGNTLTANAENNPTLAPDSEGAVTLHFTGTVTDKTALTITAKPSAFGWGEDGPSSNEVKVTVNPAPTGTITAELTGSLNVGTAIDAQDPPTITLTVADGGTLSFKEGPMPEPEPDPEPAPDPNDYLKADDFVLGGDGAAGLNIAGVSSTNGTTATLTLGGTPAVGPVDITIHKSAFVVAPAKDIEITNSIYVDDAENTAEPEFEDDSVTTTDSTNLTAVFTVTNSSAFKNPVTVALYTTAEGSEGSGNVAEDYESATYTSGTLTITYDAEAALAAVTEYYVEFTEKTAPTDGDDKKPSSPVKITVTPVTAAPVPATAIGTTTDNKNVDVGGDVLRAYADYTSGNLNVAVYDDLDEAKAASENEAVGVRGKIEEVSNDGDEKTEKLVLVFNEAVIVTDDNDKTKHYFVVFTYNNWAASDPLDVTVTFLLTTATPVLADSIENETVTAEKGNMSAEIPLKTSYTGTPVVTVTPETNLDKTGGKAPAYSTNKITLNFSEELSQSIEYTITVTEGDKLQSGPLTVTVVPYENDNKNGITAVSALLGTETINAADKSTNETTGDADHPIPFQFILDEEQSQGTFSAVTLKLDSDKSKVAYFSGTSVAADSAWEELEETTPDGTTGTATATIDLTSEEIILNTASPLYIRVTSEAKAEELADAVAGAAATTVDPKYYEISVKELAIKAADPAESDVTLGNNAGTLTKDDIKGTAVAADSRDAVNQAILQDIEDTGALDDLDAADYKDALKELLDESDFEVKFYYIPSLALEVESYDETAKTYEVDITPKYTIVAAASDVTDPLVVGTNAVFVATSPETFKLTGVRVEVEIAVPSALLEGNTDNTIYVKHDQDDWVECTADGDATDGYTVTIEVTGFSPFKLQATSPAVAVVTGDDTIYDTVQKAIDAVGASGEITLTEKAKESAVKATLKSLTPPALADQSTFTIVLCDGLTKDDIAFVSKDVEEGGKTYTYSATFTVSGNTLTVTVSKTEKQNQSGGQGGNEGGDGPSNPGTGTSGSGGSSGGSGASSSATVGEASTSGGTTTVEVSANSTTSGTTARATISSSNMNKAVDAAIAEAAKRGTSPVVEVSVATSAKADSLNVTLPTASLETLADARGSSLIISSDVVTVSLDHTALAALADRANSSTVTLKVAPVESYSLTSTQQNAVGGATVVDVSLVSGSTVIRDYNNGTITVTLPYELPSGVSARDVVVYYLEDNGSLTPCSTRYSNGQVTFTTNHLSKYVIADSDLANRQTGSKFYDVSASAYYANAVDWAVEKGVAFGVDNTHFGPDLGCTRAQFVTFLWRAAGSPSPVSSENKFSDVSATAHAGYYNAILWAVEQGITYGTGDGSTFSPDQVVTRAQSVTFMHRYAQKAGIATRTGVSRFDDVTSEGATAAYYDAIGWAVANNITAGNSTTANTFGPMDDCNRGMMITFLYRLFTGNM